MFDKAAVHLCEIGNGLCWIQCSKCPVRYLIKKRLGVLKINTQVCGLSLFTARPSDAKYALAVTKCDALF